MDELIAAINAQPEMADSATLSVDVLDLVTFAPPAAFVNPALRDSMANGMNAAAVANRQSGPCAAIPLAVKLLQRVDGLATPSDWVLDATLRALMYAKLHALAAEYQAQANLHGGCAPTGVEPSRGSDRVAIQYVRPTPTEGAATIGFGIPRRSHVTLAIFDLGGRRLRTLVDGDMSAGIHTATWDGRGDRGEMAPSGIYFAHLISAGVEDVRRIVVVE